MKAIKMNKLDLRKKNLIQKQIKNDKDELIELPILKKNLFIKEKQKLIKYKYITLILIIIIFFLIIYIYSLVTKFHKLQYTERIYRLLRDNTDVNVDLFLKNKTKFYYKARKKYIKKIHAKYNESNLKSFQDKLNYLIIHESPEYKSNVVNKIKLSDYSKKILGKDICIPILKVYNNPDEIILDELPAQFVLKCNHGSGMNIFCKNKTEFDLEGAKKQLNEWMDTNYGLWGAELPYYFVERKILASPYMGDNIIDYKTFCFNGNPKFIAARKILNKERNRFIYNYYDLNWTLTDIEYGSSKYKRDPKEKFKKPQNLDLLIEYAKKLSNEFVFVRVDFYEINGTIYLGELTFVPSNILNSFKNKAQRNYLGSLLDVTKIKPYLFNK